jgi:hypothetical protein
MTVEEMIKQALEHKHEPNGVISWHYVGQENSQQFSHCICGVTLERHTAPLGADYNWEDWERSL